MLRKQKPQERALCLGWRMRFTPPPLILQTPRTEEAPLPCATQGLLQRGRKTDCKWINYWCIKHFDPSPALVCNTSMPDGQESWRSGCSSRNGRILVSGFCRRSWAPQSHIFYILGPSGTNWCNIFMQVEVNLKPGGLRSEIRVEAGSWIL